MTKTNKPSENKNNSQPLIDWEAVAVFFMMLSAYLGYLLHRQKAKAKEQQQKITEFFSLHDNVKYRLASLLEQNPELSPDIRRELEEIIEQMNHQKPILSLSKIIEHHLNSRCKLEPAFKKFLDSISKKRSESTFEDCLEFAKSVSGLPMRCFIHCRCYVMYETKKRMYPDSKRMNYKLQGHF